MPKPLLLDTDVLIDFLRGHGDAISLVAAGSERLMVSSISVAELYAGVRGSADGAEQPVLKRLLSLFRVMPVSDDIARLGGLYKRDYGRSHGVGPADGIIAATVSTEDAELMTLNVRNRPTTCYAQGMEQLPLWITPALVLGLFAWFRFMFPDLKENMNARMTELKTDTKNRIDDLKTDTTNLKADINNRFAEINRRFESLGSEMHQRFDQVSRELADNRERMAKLEGALEGFLAGRRDRNAA